MILDIYVLKTYDKLQCFDNSEGLGINMAAMMGTLVGTNDAILKGNTIFSPVSGWNVLSTTTLVKAINKI